MTNEELVAANESLAALLREALTELEKVKAERDAAAVTSEALANKLANQRPKKQGSERVHVSCFSESELDDMWFHLDSDYKPYYQDNGPSDPKRRWQFEIWDWNVKTHVIANAATKEDLENWEPELMSAFRAGMYAVWRFASKRMWDD